MFGEKQFGELVATPVANSRSHEDIHYLWRLRKALAILLKEDTIDISEEQIISVHTQIVQGLINGNMSHWYDSWSPSLDDSLPEDLKLASEGYYPKEDSGILELEDAIEREIYMEHEATALWYMAWKAPTSRKDVPASHFFDPKNKKYPYKNSDGKINCKGVLAAKQAAAGARSGKKASASIRAKINRVWKNACGEKTTKDKKKKEGK